MCQDVNNVDFPQIRKSSLGCTLHPTRIYSHTTPTIPSVRVEGGALEAHRALHHQLARRHQRLVVVRPHGAEQGSEAAEDCAPENSASAVQQLLMKAAMTKELWHDSTSFCTPEQLRLQRHLRTRKLKCEMTGNLGQRMSALQLISEKQQASASSADTAGELLDPPADSQQLVAPPRMHSTIRGLARLAVRLALCRSRPRRGARPRYTGACHQWQSLQHVQPGHAAERFVSLSSW
eukprot:3234490-Pleurochrysis_carterae.AAC.5